MLHACLIRWEELVVSTGIVMAISAFA